MKKIIPLACLTKTYNSVKSLLSEEQFFASLIMSAILSFSLLYLFKQMKFLNLTNVSTAISILTAIASILASIIGIIIAISLVSFSLQREIYGSSAFERFFQNLPFRFLLWFFISTIIITILASVSIGQNITVINQWLFKAALFLFIYCLLILPFGVQEILTSGEPKRRIKRSIDSLIKVIKNTKVAELSLSLELQRKVSSLKEIFLGMLREDDRNGIALILSEFSKKNLENFENKNGVANSEKFKYGLNLLEYFSMESFKHKNEFALREILNCLREVRETVVACNQKTDLMSSIDEFIRRFLLQGVENDFVSVCGKGFEFLEENLTNDLKVHPYFCINKANKDSFETIKYFQETYLETAYLSTLDRIMEKAIDLKRYDIIHRGLLSIQTITASVVLNDNLDNYVRQNIINKSYALIKLITIKCVDKKVYERVSESIFYAFGIIFHFFTKDTYMYETPTKYFSQTLIYIAARGAIDLNYYEMGLPYMFGTAKKSLEHLSDNEHFLNILNIVIDTFVGISIAVENKTNPLEEARVNAVISTYFETLLNLMKDENIHNGALEKKILSILDKLKT
jgi:hypothetical protein